MGAIGLVRYPLSLFRRVEVQTSFGLGSREGLRRGLPGGQTAFDTLRTGTLTNTLALVHDNALYQGIGPVEGWRGSVSAGYVTDVLYSNESYLSLGADVRHYLRIAPGVSFASWGQVRSNVGRRARLNLLGGSWDLRGFPFLRVRGQNLWFTSHELRFPVLPRPPLFPLLTTVRGALFVDAAHNWNTAYNERTPDPDFDAGGQLLIGSTKGSLGAGLRGVVLGAFVLRYDVGWRFTDGFDWSERQAFRQFFFGFDF